MHTKMLMLCLMLAALTLVACSSDRTVPSSSSASYPVMEPPPLEELSLREASEDTYYYPPGELALTSDRDAYQSGEMWLYIPRLGGKWPVYNDVDQQTLTQGIGLFQQAQLPVDASVNSNTSIAGHRDICHMEFYYIDTVQTGDLMYLTYNDTLFTYEVYTQFVTHDSDWDPIRIKEFSCLTLMSCTPIGVASHRIFTVGRLIDVTPGAGFPQGEEPISPEEEPPQEEEPSQEEASPPEVTIEDTPPPQSGSIPAIQREGEAAIQKGTSSVAGHPAKEEGPRQKGNHVRVPAAEPKVPRSSTLQGVYRVPSINGENPSPGPVPYGEGFPFLSRKA